MRATTATKAKATKATKPYDRPEKKGKGKDEVKAAKDTHAVNIGAPAAKQSSRKGKKAWRKNVDVTAEESAMEVAREEERVTGGKVHEKRDGDLFTIDTVGDAEVARKVRPKKPLRSLAVLNERSAVPSLVSRVSAVKKEKRMSTKDKNRIRRIARKTADTSTSADVREVDVDTLADVWSAPKAIPRLEGDFGNEAIYTPPVKVPAMLKKQHAQRRTTINPDLPTTGVSYNPAAAAHAALMSEALAEEKERLLAEKREAERIELLGEVVSSRRVADILAEESRGLVRGMAVGRGDGVDSDGSDDSDEEGGFKPKPTKRKTQAQRNKKLRAREAAHAAKLEKERSKLEKAIPGAKALGKNVEARQRAQEEAKRLRKLAAEQRTRAGFTGGEKVGKHRVGKSAVEVQLGEDLAESLRQVKPEGNLFKNHFLNLQRRALIEPRVPQLPKKRTLKVKEYEKHAWKKFT